jgi:hypothetical protein
MRREQQKRALRGATMLRDNLAAGLIEPMAASEEADSLAGHHKAGQTGGCSRSTEVAIVALK